MERELTDKEIRNLKEIISTGSGLAKYGKIIVIIFSFFILGFFVFLYTEIQYGSIYIYIIIAVTLSIVEGLVVYNVTTPYIAIEKGEYSCLETRMISNRIVTSQTSQGRKVKYYYLMLNIKGENKEIKYEGKSFYSLNIGDKIIVVCTRNKLNKSNYMCFSYEELNREKYDL